MSVMRPVTVAVFFGLFFPLLLLPHFAKASEPLILEKTDRTYRLSGAQIEVLEDQGRSLGIDDVLSAGWSSKFSPARQQVPNFGMTDSAFWLRFSLDIRQSLNTSWVLFLDQPLMDEVDLYVPDNSGAYKVLRSGDMRPMNIRAIPGKNIVFPLENGPGVRTYYLRGWIPGRAQFPLSIESSDAFRRRETNEGLLYGAYAGLMLAMACFGLFLLILFRDRSYFYYVVYVLGYLTTQLGTAGYVSLLFPEYPRWVDFIIVGAASPMAMVSMHLFTRMLLRTFEYAPRHHTLLLVMAWLSAATFVLWPVAPVLFLKKFVLLNFLAGTIASLSTAVVVYRERYHVAKYFLYSRILVYSGHAAFILVNFNLAPFGSWVGKAMLAVSIADAAILAFALADGIRRMSARISLLASDLQKEVLERTEANLALQSEMDERAKLQREIVRVSDEERRRFSHELHDGLCQKLTGARLYYSALADHLTGSRKEIPDLAPLGRLLDQSVNDAYDLSKGLWPLEHHTKNTGPTLSDLCRRLSDRNGIHVEFLERGTDSRFEGTQLNQLYRIAQEAITNAIRHSKARAIAVSLTFCEKEGIDLTVRDNGSGIHPNSASPGGMGIPIMLHRARMIGGSLEIREGECGGTVVHCHIPPGACCKEWETDNGRE